MKRDSKATQNRKGNSTVSGGSLYTVSSPAQLAVAKALIARTCQLMFEPLT